MSMTGRIEKLEAAAESRKAAQRAAVLAGVANLVHWDDALSAEYSEVLIEKNGPRLGAGLSRALARVRSARPEAISIGQAIVRRVESEGADMWGQVSEDELMASIAAIANSQDWYSGAGAAVLYACDGHVEPTAHALAAALTQAERDVVALILSPDVAASFEQEQLIWEAIAREPELVNAVRALMAERGLFYDIQASGWVLVTAPRGQA